MAGIGFQLKKLFSDKGYLYKLRAYFFSTIVTTGPIIMCTCLIVFIQLFMNVVKLPYIQKQLIIGSIVYPFVFSQIITSVFSMVITRYVSDLLYKKEYNKINASFMGVITLSLIIGGVLGFAFYARSPLHIRYKIPPYILFMELIILWLQTVYLSAFRDYMRIVKGFLYGILIIVITIYICLSVLQLDVTMSILIGMDVGFFVIVSMLTYYIIKYFNKLGKDYFVFIKYIDKYASLIYISFFYTLGIYGHNFLFWKSNLGVTIFETYVFAPVYDVAVFYAFLTVLPATVIFVVNVETSFYERYKEYYSLITTNGNGMKISKARDKMIYVLWQEIRKLIEIQFFISLLCMILGNIFLPYVGVTGLSLNIFIILSLGSFCCFMMFFIMLILLYFEDRKGAALVISFFFIGNILLTQVSIRLGEVYYGFGFFIASIMGFAIAVTRLTNYLNEIDYHTFCSQPVIARENSGVFHRIVKVLYKDDTEE
ncbi:exopolysaccharide Pel transporter PelG [Vallitalea guaymasensis]|uniref:exopolysaccharide Pel transporter PelG n=1 Tax=Vallitalea guaymasensis TaxID=1185412 RepID=UPI0023532692|nr:exopolysaccharide Pel transporter PelG [Vallitalea guaymasensis]